MKLPPQRSLMSMRHRRAVPVPVLLPPPDERRGDDLVTVAIDIRPHLDRLADDPLDREAAAVDRSDRCFRYGKRRLVRF